MLFLTIILVALTPALSFIGVDLDGGKGQTRLSAAGRVLDRLALPTLLKGTTLEGKSLQCIYKASKHGYNFEQFHARVDCGLPSLVVAQIKGSKTLIGGFNPFGYSSVDDYRSSTRAFLFRQEAAGKEIEFSRPLSADGAIYDFGTYGPIFGVEALVIPLNPSKLKPTCRATSVLGNDYSILKGSEGGTGISARRDGKTATLFGGKNTVDLSELEVYVNADEDVEIRGDVGQGIFGGMFSWGGYGR